MNWSDILDKADLEFLRSARVGRLATIGVAGFPSVVPVCFGLIDEQKPMVVIVLDEKPKKVIDPELGRVRNIERHPNVGFTVDHYEDDWTKLAYIQIRGVAQLVRPQDALHATSLEVLRAKYRQYEVMNLERRMVIAIGDLRVKIWRAE